MGLGVSYFIIFWGSQSLCFFPAVLESQMFFPNSLLEAKVLRLRFLQSEESLAQILKQGSRRLTECHILPLATPHSDFCNSLYFAV